MPYCGSRTPTASSTLNTFSGFPFEKYTPTRKVDAEKTMLYEYLKEVFGFGEKGALLDYILDRLAFMVQFPEIRSERITILRSKAEGSGKSFWARLCRGILGSQYVRFLDSLEAYLDKFNIQLMGSLVIFVDDVSASSARTTRRLFSKTTCSYQAYQQKNETTFQVPEFSDIFITANNTAPLHVTVDDRRQCVLEASDRQKQNRKFFGAVAEQLRDLDICYAFYKYLKHRPLGDFHPSKNPPSNAKAATITACRVKSHTFVGQFFAPHEWLKLYRPLYMSPAKWVEKVDISTLLGKRNIRMEVKQLYSLYKRFVHEQFPSSKARNQDTFLSELQDLGVVRHEKRQKVNGKNHSAVDIQYPALAENWKRMYSSEIGEWDSETSPVDFAKLYDEMRTNSFSE
jgi:hypothetical protein